MASQVQADRLRLVDGFRDQWWAPLSGLLAIAVGLVLGVALNSSLSETIVSLVFIGVGTLITLRYPLAGLLLALVLQPFIGFAYLVVNLGSGIPDITLGRALTLIVFSLVLVQGLFGRRLLPRVSTFDVVMALSAFGIVLMAVRGRSITVSLQMVFDMFLTAYALYYIAKNRVTDQWTLATVLWTVTFIGAYCGLYGIFTQMTGISLFLPDGQLFLINEQWYTENLRLMRGLLDSPHIFGTVYGLAIPIQFYLLIKARTPQARLLAGLFLLLTLGGLFFTYRRTSYLAAGAGLLVLYACLPRFRRLFVPLLIGIGFVAWLYTDEIGESALLRERVGQRAETFNGRTELWNTALRYAAREPWLGYGNAVYLRRSGLQAIESHYLWLMVDGGLLAIVPFVLMFIMMTVTGLKLYRARGTGLFVEPDLVAAFFAALATYLVNLTTAVINHDYPHQLFFILAGAIIGTHEAGLIRLRQSIATAPSLDSALPPVTAPAHTGD